MTSSHVAIIAGHAPSLVRFRGALIRDLIARGHGVTAIAPPHPEAAERVGATGATFVPVAFGRASIDPLGDVAAGRAIAATLRREGVDTVLAYTIKPVVYGIPAAAQVGVATRVALITGLGYPFGSASLRQRAVGAAARWLYRRAMRHATAVLFQNPDDRDDFVKLGLVDARRASVVAGSGVDLEAFPFRPAPCAVRVRFLLIARLLADKGVGDFVKAARALRSRRDDCEFHVIGPPQPPPMGIQDQELRAWRSEGVIDLFPAVDDVRPHLAACHVFVLPSYYREGTPRTILEALAVGRPIVTTDTPGCRETTVDGDNGFLVPPRDPDALATAMERLADDPDMRERMGRRSREIATSTYDVRIVNHAMLRALGIAGT